MHFWIFANTHVRDSRFLALDRGVAMRTSAHSYARLCTSRSTGASRLSWISDACSFASSRLACSAQLHTDAHNATANDRYGQRSRMPANLRGFATFVVALARHATFTLAKAHAR